MMKHYGIDRLVEYGTEKIESIIISNNILSTKTKAKLIIVSVQKYRSLPFDMEYGFIMWYC